jgi:hypothetical protein
MRTKQIVDARAALAVLARGGLSPGSVDDRDARLPERLVVDQWSSHVRRE